MNRLLVVLFVGFVGVGGWLLIQSGPAVDDAQRGSVTVVRGSVQRTALATGRVEPITQVGVKSLTGGTVHQLFVELGERVEAGAPLAEVRPVMTAAELISAERAVAAARIAEERAREYLDGEHLASGALRLMQGRRELQRMHEQAIQGRERAEERLRLLRKGKVDVDGREIDFIVRAPVAGNVIFRHVRQGDPVVGASSYGSGTVLVTLADMKKIVFRGEVDEIDVGRIADGMDASVELAARPDLTLAGVVDEIALKATDRDGAVVFGLRIGVDIPEGVTMRSGYSAVARVIVERAADALVIPERVLGFRGEQPFVELAQADGRSEVRDIQLGISDGLTVVVTAGLAEGERVLEPR